MKEKKSSINRSTKLRLFFDMDGTLAEFRYGEEKSLYKKGYFYNLRPNMNIINAAKELSKEYEVYVLSSVLTDSKYALSEKNEWLDRYLPEVSSDRRIFPPCGKSTDKSKYIKGGIGSCDILIDDYKDNITKWASPGSTVKVSKDLADSVKESSRYLNVISPDMDVSDILNRILSCR